MQTDQVITRRGILLRGAGVAATGVAVAALGVNTAAADPREDGSPVGSWLITAQPLGFPTITAVAVFAVGGAVTQININPPSPYTALGTWARTGAHTFTDTFWQLTPNPFPPPALVVLRVTGNSKLSGDDVTGTFTFDVFLPTDTTLTNSVFTGSGTSKGHRIEA